MATQRPRLLNPVIQAEWQAKALQARLRLRQLPHVLVVATGSATWPVEPRIVPLRHMATRALRPLMSLPPINTVAAWNVVQRDFHDDIVAAVHFERMRRPMRK